MTPTDLLLWRRAHKTGQARLAELLGVSRQTVSSWERGVHPIPDAMVTRILAFNPATAPALPAVLTHENAKLRPDLALYETMMTSTRGRIHYDGKEHPRSLLPHCYPGGDAVPFSILEHDIYKAALVAHRAQAAIDAAKRAARGPFPLAIPPDTEE